MDDTTELEIPYRPPTFDEFGTAHEAHLFDPPFYVIKQCCDYVTDAPCATFSKLPQKRWTKAMMFEPFDAKQLCPSVPQLMMDTEQSSRRTSERNKTVGILIFKVAYSRISPWNPRKKGENVVFSRSISRSTRIMISLQEAGKSDSRLFFSVLRKQFFTHIEADNKRSWQSYCLAAKTNFAAWLLK